MLSKLIKSSCKVFIKQVRNIHHIINLTQMNYDARKESLQSDQESEEVEIYLSCKDITETVVIAEVFLQQGNKQKNRIFRSKPTEITNKITHFAGSIKLIYVFQIRQKLHVEVYDASNPEKKSMGTLMVTIGQIFNARQQGIAKPILHGNKSAGQMILKGQKVDGGNNNYVSFSVQTKNLDAGGICCFSCFGSSGKARWTLNKIVNNSEFLLYTSEIKQGKSNNFNQISISEKKLCNNNPKQPIIIRFFKDESSSIIGQTKLDLNTLIHVHRHTITKGNSEKGLLFIKDFTQSVKYKFTDYLTSGMQMAMVLCIDFTASNGLQNDSTSLHHHTASKKSPYEEALHQVCNIVLDYDTDKQVPCFGFGAKVNLPNFSSHGKVHHCFPINGSQANPNLFQLPGIMEGYRNCLPSLQFSGPTLFAPLLKQAMTQCSRMKNQRKQYMILLILTDGAIHDKPETMDLLVKCGRLPLSVIIIGIGNGDDWSIMQELNDNDCQMRDFQGNKSIRDLVAFVEFSKYNNNGVQLAKHVLQELPRQVEEYHQLCGFTPEIYQNNLLSDDLMQQKRVK